MYLKNRKERPKGSFIYAIEKLKRKETSEGTKTYGISSGFWSVKDLKIVYKVL